ncbi:TPA: hypothetical protein DCL30_03775 [Candidatus Peribacteria bacterium]|nr:MAG: hypothetical protein A3J91_00540 [Candidatus Peribacteria bacterium RIFOXYC2_FULL_58_10]OGJ84831.1 MAG: hypothetical protein A2529_00735 [Candidatus Peribacteria bacterium RIFOXYD2_FULL_58_15]HAI98624.1 hypothetical protein [Candidatus Peribacteria bacterium]HAS34337.1 hypothetical protein [Candidatus Peribacteria bacterium]
MAGLYLLIESRKFLDVPCPYYCKCRRWQYFHLVLGVYLQHRHMYDEQRLFGANPKPVDLLIVEKLLKRKNQLVVQFCCIPYLFPTH